ncbi:hypothetical protein BASA81_010761 [Batrachochytrium salamandrivorans]|nr:hypothetical protein BASA81_010761 [Batrachochytrium salamandrivorans]
MPSVFVWALILVGERILGSSCPLTVDMHELVLDSTGVGFALGWKLNDSAITLRLHANVETWLGFGLSEAGHMLGSDIVTARFDGTVPVIEDRFVHWASSPNLSPFPTLDLCQDWQVVCAFRGGNGTSTFVLERKLISMDKEDRNFTLGVLPVVYAWGQTGDQVVTDHGARRGTVGIDFFHSSSSSSKQFPVPEDADDSVYVGLEYDMSRPTEYVVQQFDLGLLVRQVVGVDLRIRDEDQRYVHHILLHDCGGTPQAFPLMLISNSTAGKMLTEDGLSPLLLGACHGLVFGYGLGGSAQVFPNVTGYRLDPQTRFLVLEIHLDNPAGVSKRIQSGLELYTTSTLREYNSGTMVLADPEVRYDAIPHSQSAMAYTSVCPAECTRKFKGNIHVTHVFPHMHMFGREIWTSLVYSNDATEEIIISSRKFWSFSTQTNSQVNITIQPGSVLTTTCVYDTLKSPTNVQFGHSSGDEMCMDFISYYPKDNGVSKCGYRSLSATSCGDDTVQAVEPPSTATTTRVPDPTGTTPATCLPSDNASPIPDSPSSSSSNDKTMIVWVLLVLVGYAFS